MPAPRPVPTRARSSKRIWRDAVLDRLLAPARRDRPAPTASLRAIRGPAFEEVEAEDDSLRAELVHDLAQRARALRGSRGRRRACTLSDRARATERPTGRRAVRHRR